MKKNYLKALLGGIAFSILFYEKSIGLNLLLSALLITGFYFSQHQWRKAPWFYLLSYILTAIAASLLPTFYTIFAHFMALFIFIGKTISASSSIYTNWLIGFVNITTASLANLSEKERNNSTKIKAPTKMGASLLGIIIAILLSTLFTFMYQDANPVFSSLVDKIDLSFISPGWIAFTMLGYFIFLHILRPNPWQSMVDTDARMRITLTQPSNPLGEKEISGIETEHMVGSIVLGFLNLLLIIFLVTDFFYQINQTEMSYGDFSQSVHKGIYTLIFSIICAISIILFFFRGNLNFFQKNSTLKRLSYLWILLNAVLVVFTWHKNQIYVENLGFTYKRIGVFIYLLLTLSGLVTTYFKVKQQRTFVFMARTNASVFFLFMVLATVVPWDNAITWYNLSNIQEPDIHYLMNLGSDNSHQLLSFSKENKKKISIELKTKIEKRYSDWVRAKSKKTWQEITYYQILY